MAASQEATPRITAAMAMAITRFQAVATQVVMVAMAQVMAQVVAMAEAEVVSGPAIQVAAMTTAPTQVVAIVERSRNMHLRPRL